MTKPIYKLVGDRTEHFTDSYVRDIDARNTDRMTSLLPWVQQHVICTYGPKEGKDIRYPDKYLGGVIRGRTPAGAVRPDGQRKYAYDYIEQNGGAAELSRMYAIREIRGVQIWVAVQSSPRPQYMGGAAMDSGNVRDVYTTQENIRVAAARRKRPQHMRVCSDG